MLNIGFFSGVAVGLVGAGIPALLVWRVGTRRHWFDERVQAVKEKAKAQAFGVGLLLLVAAWLWTYISPAAPRSLVLLPVLYALNIVAAVVFVIRGVRRL